MNQLTHHRKRITDAWLMVSVHFDAFCFDPRAYLTAAKWWIKRKRVRARGQFAPLLNQSSKAYRLWVSRQEREANLHSLPDASCPIIGLIDLKGEYDLKDLAATIENLKLECLPYFLIGSLQTPTFSSVIDRICRDKMPWLLPLNPGDMIASGGAAAYRAAMDDPTVRVIYADDDLLVGKKRQNPYFKPDWNSELFLYYDYVSGACLLRATRFDLEAVAESTNWANQLTIRLAKDTKPLHLRKVLHHRRYRPAPRIPAQPLNIANELPSISVIVPTRNRMDLLHTCLSGLAGSDYPDVEVIVVDNDSNDPDTLAYLAALDPSQYQVLHHPGNFNYSTINNRAVAMSRGRLLCLLNNDIEVTEPNWLATLATQALRPEVGAVGARLLYPDGRIQHAGVVIGVGNAAGHAHRFLKPNEEGYFHRHSLPQFTAAVTAACLVVERNKFLAVGGLDEQNFAVAFNDVDLCLRLNQRGWKSFYEPRATLIHHESVSRGLDCDPIGAARFAKELAALKRIWKTDEVFDPYHHPQLSRASEQFAMALL